MGQKKNRKHRIARQGDLSSDGGLVANAEIVALSSPMFLGMISLVTSFLLVGIIFGALVIFNIARIRKRIKHRRKLLPWAIGFGLGGIAVGFLSLGIYIRAYSAFSQQARTIFSIIFGFVILLDCGIVYLVANYLPRLFADPNRTYDDFIGYERNRENGPRSALLPDDLVASKDAINLRLLFEETIECAQGICLGDWNQDGEPEVLVVDAKNCLRVYDHQGNNLGQIDLPVTGTHLEMGTQKSEPALLVTKVWEKEVTAIGKKGDALWRYRCRSGINGAHFRDINGDGESEAIIGSNGLGGFHVLNSKGRRLWRTWRYGNVWNQDAIPRKSGDESLLLLSHAGGSIELFSSNGEKIRSIKPLNLYCSTFRAASVNGPASGQILAFANHPESNLEYAVCCDVWGNILWKTPCRSEVSWRLPTTDCADLDGDGLAEWVFERKSGEIVICSSKGELLASLHLSQPLSQAKMIGRGNGKPGILAVLAEKRLSVYSVA